MFPDTCTNCQSDRISGPHDVLSGVLGHSTIAIKPDKKIGMNKSVKIASYICMNCGEIKLMVDKADLDSLNKSLQEHAAD